MNNRTLQKEDKKVYKPREFLEKCEDCGTMSKVYRMFDIDGKNLVEHMVCLDCGTGMPSIK